MSTNFWRLEAPDYDSDYRYSYINGSLEHPFSLPGVECDVCGATWGGSRILARECPQSLRQHKNLVDGWPISLVDHAKLQQEVMAKIGMHGQVFVDLRPGDTFQPGFLDIPSRPTADFLWPCLGSFVVADRIKDLLLEFCSTDVAVCSVTPRKIGTLDATLPPPMPSTGEPEDILNEVPLVEDGTTAGSYSEILVLNQSDFPPGGTPISVCQGCKREASGENREFRMIPTMWKGQAIFFLATTLHVIVTDDLKKRIDRLQPTNVVFNPI